MKKTVWSSLCAFGAASVFIVGMVVHAQVAETRAQQLRRLWGENPAANDADERGSRVKTSLGHLWTGILEMAKGRPIGAEMISGFSGTGFANQAGVENDLTQLIRHIASETKSTLGENAVTVLALGGTTDGIGVGYDIIDQLQKNGEIKKGEVIVVGLVSDQAVKFHAERLEKGLGEVISSKQDLIYLAPTYTDASGSQTWELKTSPGAASNTVRFLLDAPPEAQRVTMHVVGGGRITLTEALEFVLAAGVRGGETRKPELSLHLGYLEGRLDKLSGFNAATQMAKILVDRPFLALLDNTKISVSFHMAGAPIPELPLSMIQRADPKVWIDPNGFASSEDTKTLKATDLRQQKFNEATSQVNSIITQEFNDHDKRFSENIRVERAAEAQRGAGESIRPGDVVERARKK